MSSLQIGLIVAGIVLVVGVILYNVWQERRLTRRVAQARPSADRPDANVPARAGERVEPTLGAQRASTTPASAPEGAPAFRPGTARDSTFEPPLDVIAPPTSFEVPDDIPAETSAAAVATNIAPSDAPTRVASAHTAGHGRAAPKMPPDISICDRDAAARSGSYGTHASMASRHS